MASSLLNQPLVSIIMPFYRHDRYLRDAVESVRQQTYFNWELIVVDDASDGRAASEILGDLAAQSPKITIIRHEKNQGVARAKNTAIAACKGDLILPFDSDDLLQSDYLEKCVSKLFESQADGIYTDFDIFGVENRLACSQTNPVRILSGWFPPNPVLMRKEVMEEVGGYDPDFDLGEDACFWISAYSLGRKFAHLHEPLYRYRRHPESGTLMRGPDYPLIMTRLVRKFPHLYSQNVIEIIDLLSDHWIQDIHKHRNLLQEHHKKEVEYNHLHSEFHRLLSSVEHSDEARVRYGSIKQTLKLLISQIGNRLKLTCMKTSSQSE